MPRIEALGSSLTPSTGIPTLVWHVCVAYMTNSWYQPAIDAFGHALMERFNKLPDHHGLASRLVSGLRNAQKAELQPVVYVTYQAYLRRSVPILV